MKASKFAFVIAFVAFATMVFAQAERPSLNESAPLQRCVKISLEKAVLDRALKKAMYQQISPRILLNDQKIYTAKVLHNRTVYFIYGRFAEWKSFFKMDFEDDPIKSAPRAHTKLPGLTK